MRTPLTFADRLIKAHQRRSPRRTAMLAIACLVGLSLSAWGVVEGNHGRYRQWASHWLGPLPPTLKGSAPPGLAYDLWGIAICGLLFCVAATALLLLALAALLAQRRDRLTPPTR